jgi:hypothetical protein
MYTTDWYNNEGIGVVITSGPSSTKNIPAASAHIIPPASQERSSVFSAIMDHENQIVPSLVEQFISGKT